MLQRSSRLAGVLALTFICLVSLPSLLAQQATPSPAPSPTPAPTATPVPPEEKALDAAGRITDPAARLAALNKIRADYPHSDLVKYVDQQIFSLLVLKFPDRTRDINQAIDRLRANVTPDDQLRDRFLAALNPAAQLIANDLMFDRAEALLTEASGLASFEAVAKDERTLAEKSKRPVPADDVLRARLASTYQIPLLEQQGRLRLAKGDVDGAERAFKDAIALRPPNSNPGTLADGLGEVAEALAAKGEGARAETLLRQTLDGNQDFQRLYLAVAKYYDKHNDIEKAKATIKRRLNMTPAPAFQPGELLLADLESRSGESEAALDRYLKLAASGAVQGADYDTMAALYRKLHGSDANVETEIDRMYREKFPNPIKPEKWTPAAGRGPRLVVAQLFTGSGCGPCVAADLSIDAMMERYPTDVVVPLLYHVHWPRPDPMTTSGGATFANTYVTEGVPTLIVDGSEPRNDKGDTLDGGPRAEAPRSYKDFVAAVDKAVNVPPTAEISVRAQVNGDQVDVWATVSKLPAGAKNLRLQLVLAERELRFSGENGIRFHAMVVRATNDAKSEGVPLNTAGTQKYTFKLAAIRADIVKTLADEIATRKAMLAKNATPNFAAEGHAMTTIDTGQLVVVAFVQDADRHVLQAARADVSR